MPLENLNTESFERDGHKAAISHCDDDTAWNSEQMKRLRRDCSQLIISVCEKYNTVKMQHDIDNEEINSAVMDSNTDDLNSVGSDNDCNVHISDESVASSEYSGSVFVPEDDDIEIDPTYEAECSDDDDNVEECYTDFPDITNQPSATNDTMDVDNKELVCPGDIVEYRPHDASQNIKKCSVVSIERIGSTVCVVLKNGDVLHPHQHLIRKVKMYCTMTRTRIANPMASWHLLNDCQVQTGFVEEKDSVDVRYVYSWYMNIFLQIVFFSIVHLQLLVYCLCNRPGQRRRNNQGLTKYNQQSRMRRYRQEQQRLNVRQTYPDMKWTEVGHQDYFNAIRQINDVYRKMLAIGKVDEALRNTTQGIKYLLNCDTKAQFNRVIRNINDRYNRHRRANHGMLTNFRIDTELLPDPYRYRHSQVMDNPTNREIMTKEQILAFEQYLTTLNVFKCTTCLECHIEEKPAPNNINYTCDKCKKRKDPDFFLKNNLHPIWYLRHDDGSPVLDSHGKKVPQYNIPQELSSLTMYEKLLIRRCANFVPTVHLKNGIFGIRGHAVTFPQDITEMCDELPREKDSIVTFVRKIGNKDTTAIFPTSLRVNRFKVLNALHWLKKHNPFYHNIQIREENLDWMGESDEVNVGTDGIELEIQSRPFSVRQDEEDEFVSKAHCTAMAADDGGIEIRTVHANEKVTIPSGRQAAPIQQLVNIAKETNQTKKIRNFPPIDHDSPIS